MADPTLPPPESCLHNLRRAADDGASPEPTDLCRNAVGVFHMLDCPLFIGQTCSYYEPAGDDAPPMQDAELDEVSWELRREFLSWGYTRRVRALRLPVGAGGERLEVEAIPEPDESIEILLRDTPEAEAAVAVDDDDDAPDADVPIAPAETGPSRPEQYPGQRRSEEKTGGRRARPPEAPGFGPDPEAAAEGDGEAPAAADPLRTGPPKRTVDELLESLPEAPLPEGEPRRRRSRRGRGRSHGGGDDVAPATGGQPEKGAVPGRPKPRRGRRGRRGGAARGSAETGTAGGGEAGSGASAPDATGQKKAGSGRPRRRRRRGAGGDSRSDPGGASGA